jgi:hypothetical protein
MIPTIFSNTHLSFDEDRWVYCRTLIRNVTCIPERGGEGRERERMREREGL